MGHMATAFAFVGAGGAIGAMMRYGVTLSYTKLLGFEGFWATLSVNIIGSFVIGFLSPFLTVPFQAQPSPYAPLVITGILGGFTTFSSFSFDVLQLVEGGRLGLAALYVILSFTVSILFVFIGVSCAKMAGA